MYHGVNEITITAVDASGKTGKDSLSIYFKDVIPPSIRIISPNDTIYNAQVSGNFEIALSASDNDEISRIEIFIDGILEKTLTAKPFVFEWNTTNYKNVSHSIQAKAFDKANNVSTSKKANVSVSN